MRVGGEVTAPRIVSRVEPARPTADPGQCYEFGIAVFEAVVDKRGNVRGTKQIAGPENEFTKSVLVALKRWTFEPGKCRGEPVDVIFNLVMHHVPGKKVEGPC
jgi:hypothetical protein